MSTITSGSQRVNICAKGASVQAFGLDNVALQVEVGRVAAKAKSPLSVLAEATGN